jgi:hypothetical protein
MSTSGGWVCETDERFFTRVNFLTSDTIKNPRQRRGSYRGYEGCYEKQLFYLYHTKVDAQDTEEKVFIKNWI